MENMATDEECDQYFALLGKFVHYWAYVERGIDASMVVIYHRHDHNKIVKRKIPRMFYGQKSKYVRRGFNKLPQFQPYAKKVIAFLDRADKLVGDRHYLVHGTPTELDFQAKTLVMWKPDISKKTAKFEGTDRRITFSEIETMVAEAEALSVLSTDLAQAILHEPVSEARKKTRGEIVGEFFRTLPGVDFILHKIEDFRLRCGDF